MATKIRAIISADYHCPYHDKKLFKNFLRFIDDYQPTHFILNGDIMDQYVTGQWHSGSTYYLNNKSLGDEYNSTNELLDDIDKHLPKKTTKVINFGNHEQRIYRWIKSSDNSKLDGAIVLPIEALQLRQRGYIVNDDYDNGYYKLGSYIITHGHSTSINVAMTNVTKSMQSIITGHAHRPQIVTRGICTSISLPAMCEIESPAFSYMPFIQRASWRMGFLTLDIINGVDYPQLVLASENGEFIYGNTKY